MHTARGTSSLPEGPAPMADRRRKWTGRGCRLQHLYQPCRHRRSRVPAAASFLLPQAPPFAARSPLNY